MSACATALHWDNSRKPKHLTLLAVLLLLGVVVGPTTSVNREHPGEGARIARIPSSGCGRGSKVALGGIGGIGAAAILTDLSRGSSSKKKIRGDSCERVGAVAIQLGVDPKTFIGMQLKYPSIVALRRDTNWKILTQDNPELLHYLGKEIKYTDQDLFQLCEKLINNGEEYTNILETDVITNSKINDQEQDLKQFCFEKALNSPCVRVGICAFSGSFPHG